MDECDLATQREEHYRDIAIRQARTAGPEEEPRYNDEGKRVCRDCATRIPQKRLKANPQAVRCIRCQERKETA